MKNIDLFRKDFLNANTWAQRKDGVPIDVLDKLTKEELKIAEAELINIVSLKDHWPVIGLGYIKSKSALSKLYDLLNSAEGPMKVTIAHSIFQICRDTKMADIVLNTMPTITNPFELIDILYFLPDFKDENITELHHNYRNHTDYLVAYNATQSLGLSTDEVVKKFRDKE
ncbi:hypothetical protein U0035_11750 [Niabella yanshanensis]|uniref:Uncharacterized protein n=1 Tax=Niabella yanshanensis TaxID=577386 RepID=A0ABZ0VZ81_9BACT|nr:hypothetical protein [Niabella yanshanensis]WQD36338.1 hypothetical protein U0035_11750 [Niabella yanshanensis]